MWRNSESSYGLIAVALHWLVAASVIGLFALGMWMVDLTYYHPWYQRGPAIHRSVGVLLFAVMLVRLTWRLTNPRPRHAPGVSPLEARLAAGAYVLLYALIFTVLVSGYLISTADGRPVEIFGLFQVPAALSGIDNQEDIAGTIHRLLAFVLVGLAAVHALAALKHHFIDRDRTLLRMLGRP
ncbi:MAG: cytochrome b [Gammaproteobacteria bacterium]|nr:cytochrome b [Gammaproteobacteria bacterium]NIR97702.1 cytochrome b [Gammaproteobacteria bacterium]NIT62895.1 cytochrome b [Gammaproteobacteria bacterium]NIV19860.1 cytochrome b [Gammaproteobacteria bacterium]NIX11373.1 cytochrome b [Gammaproteobacteria bacterium]